MELAEFIKFIQRRKFIIIIFTFLGFLPCFLFAYFSSTKYSASLLIYVKREAGNSSDKYYSYDGYYALQTSLEYTDTVLGLIKSLDVLKRGAEITEHIPDDNEKLNELGSRIKVIKTAPQIIKISLADEDKTKSKEIVSALAQAAKDRVRILNQTGDKALSIDLVDPTPLILEKKPSLLYLSILGTGLGFVLGLVLAALFDYLKTRN